MFNSEEHLELFTDMMSEGFIVIDNNGTIQIYNTKAKEIFGILHNQQISHLRGKIEAGDIVIIGDNAVGRDDGNLDAETLEYIGIHDKKINQDDILIAVGVYKDNNIKPVYICKRNNEVTDALKMKTRFLGIDIRVIIDLINKIITIEANGEKFSMNYVRYIGHLVILDRETKKMKFYQAQGYTARGEGLKDILDGKAYMAKGENSEYLNVIGKNIFEIHKGCKTIKEFYDVAKGENISYIDEFKEINGFPTMCTLIPVDKDGKRIGAALKVEDISEIKRVIRERDEALFNLEKIEKQLDEEKMLKELFPNIAGESRKMNYVKKLALKASNTNSTVLILGESGTGKTLIAKAIHEHSKGDGPFVHVNCGTIPETLLESELFGYEKGAFTGARTDGKKGFFEMANGGTILLDEIGEISPAVQVKLLQVLQDKSFYKVGGQEKIKVDVRVIAASNRNLEEEILKGNFREDLYYRINVFPIWIPPLRERKEDIYSLVEILLPAICDKIGCSRKNISVEALNILLNYDWPGNVRELENILERAINLCDGNTIFSKHLILKPNVSEKFETKDIIPLKKSVEEFEKKTIEKVLKLHKGNKNKTMKSLGISKTTFYEKLKNMI
ncbi:MAG: sigma 54-interacting transcriptional regulator [Tepidanaerobacter acetatoxydans]|jgi:transcriptional regulator with PAS, ATPase and Fis domain|uniref:sigma-54 interaction domain-containing protein n=1 Tax=Tepidanaerobacter acetatoxydans TaxID=499229 RepID=UPI0026F21D9D|nr:sigma 54-interacting transcriptional regulator [Tepidanaerobacter acetatoxydans]NLU10777.1 sigma 54-interacting transcriptional regulator [Tepidanaerobacter acetatoxydans]